MQLRIEDFLCVCLHACMLASRIASRVQCRPEARLAAAVLKVEKQLTTNLGSVASFYFALGTLLLQIWGLLGS